ncbi:MAG: MFS transporter [Zestosphaera sp.]
MRSRGLYKWVVLVLCIVNLMLVVASQLAVVSPSIPVYMEVFSVSAAVASLLTSVWALARVITSVPASAVAARLGTRPAFITGVLLSTVGWVTAAVAPDYWTVLAGRFVMGLGAGVIPTVAPVVISEWFEREELGTAMGFWSSSMTLGLVWELPLTAWVISNWGWRYAYALFAVVSLIMVGPLIVLLRRQPPHPLNPSTVVGGFRVLELLSDHTYLMVCVAIFFGVGVWSAYTTYVVKWCMAKGYDYMSASLLGAVLNAGCIASQAVAGWVSDRFLHGRRRPIFLFGSLLGVLTSLLFTYTPPGVTTTLTIATMGVAMAPILVTMFAAPLDIAKPEQRSLAMGVAGTFIYIAYTLTLPIGHIYDAHGLVAATTLTAIIGLAGASIMYINPRKNL